MKPGRYPASVEGIVVDETGQATLVVVTRGREKQAFQIPLGSTMEEEENSKISRVLRHIETKYGPVTAGAYIEEKTKAFGIRYWLRMILPSGSINREKILDEINEIGG